MTILITDIFIRKAFDVINIFKHSFPDQELILTNSTGKSLKSKILYNQKSARLRTAVYQLFELDLLTIIDSNPDNALIYLPVEERTTCLFYEFIRNNPSSRIKFLLPNQDSFNIARNKESLRKFCENNDIPVPKQYLKEEIDFSGNNFNKLIVKPKEGSGSKGIFFVDNKDEISKLNEIDFDKFLVQRQINNSSEVYGAFYLMNEGEVVTSYGHKRIRTYPMRGGVTVYSKLCNEENVLKIGEELLKKLNWTGFAMVEFLYDELDGDFKVIEINPRLWGSVMLSEFCGANFMGNYIRLIKGERIKELKSKDELFIRWIFPFDLINYIKTKGQIKDFWNIARKNCCYINFSYTSKLKAMIFILFSLFEVEKFKKIGEKIFT